MAKPLNRERGTAAVLRSTPIEKVLADKNKASLLRHSEEIEKSLEKLLSLPQEYLFNPMLDERSIKQNARILSKMSTDRLSINTILSEMKDQMGLTQKEALDIFPMDVKLRIDAARGSRTSTIDIITGKVKAAAETLYPKLVLPSSISIYNDLVNPIVKNLGMQGIVLEENKKVEDFIFAESFDVFDMFEVYHLYGVKGKVNEDYVKSYFNERFSLAKQKLYETFSGRMFKAGWAVGEIEDVLGDFRNISDGKKEMNILEILEKVKGDVLRTSRPRMTWRMKDGNKIPVELHWLIMKDDIKNVESLLTENAKALALDEIDYFGYATFDTFKTAYKNNQVLDADVAYKDLRATEVLPKTPELMVKDLYENKIIRRVKPYEYSQLGIPEKVKFAYVRSSESQKDATLLEQFEEYFKKESRRYSDVINGK